MLSLLVTLFRTMILSKIDSLLKFFMSSIIKTEYYEYNNKIFEIFADISTYISIST